MSTPSVHPRVIKRKPAPSIDARYPIPDPDDPFAPLWVLRSRSSNGALALSPAPDTHALKTLRGRKPSYDLYPSFLDDPPAVLKEIHYRRRSQSTPPAHVAQGQVTVAFPTVQSNPYIYGNTPSLLTDDTCSTDVDPAPATVTTKPVVPPWPSTPIRLARLLMPKRTRSSLPSTPPARKPTTSISSASFVHISSPSISTTYSCSPDDAHAYTSPRAAPTPIPTSTSAPLPSTTTHKHHTRHPLSLSFHSPTPHPPPPTATTHAQPAQPEWSHPTPAQLARAAALPVVAASGLRVPFGSLFATRRTVVVFVRHFWCPLCQDYISSVVETVQPGVMFASEGEGEGGGSERVDLVVISNGAPAFISKYRQVFGLSCQVYTDPALAVYTALGMARAVPSQSQLQCTAVGEGSDVCTPPSVQDGGYVRHGMVGGIAMVLVRALKAGMPVWEKGGDIHQLGGEFVLGPGLKCTYAHRMQSPKGHAPIRDVLFAAGIRLPLPKPTPTPTPPLTRLTTPTPTKRPHRRNSTITNPSSTHEFEFGAWRRHSMARTEGAARRSVTIGMSLEEETKWMQERMRSLERLRERKSERRGAFVGYLGPGSGKGGREGEGDAGRSDGGQCSPVREVSAERGVDVGPKVDLGGVMVIGFGGGQVEGTAEGGTAEGETADDEHGGISPTGATEGDGERDET
ncbi:hypothetical protein FPV67DRAFT_894675 [Lyophyllum atratum]|nr:hypothetical protein FPV67DRAFT_894675 [Lyophyllum atratum]